MTISPLAGKLLPPSALVDVPRLVTAECPIPRIRGSAWPLTPQAIADPPSMALSTRRISWRLARRSAGVDGALFIGIDTHALSRPALATALEVFAANKVDTFIDKHDGYTPTPVISHAILTYNRGRTTGSSSRRRTIHRRMAASNITRPTADRPTSMSRATSSGTPTLG
jgi:phosphoglucomutase